MTKSLLRTGMGVRFAHPDYINIVYYVMLGTPKGDLLVDTRDKGFSKLDYHNENLEFVQWDCRKDWDIIEVFAPATQERMFCTAHGPSIWKKPRNTIKWQWICKDKHGEHKMTTSFYETIKEAQDARTSNRWTVIEKYLPSEKSFKIEKE